MKYFNSNGHLTDESTALYADAMGLEKVGELPENILDHVDSCIECHQQVVELYSVLTVAGMEITAPHPTLGETIPPKKTTTSKWWIGGVAFLIFCLVSWFGIQQFTKQSESYSPQETEQSSPPPAIDSTNQQKPMPKKPEPDQPKEKIYAEKETTPPPTEPVGVKTPDRELFAANFETNDEFEGLIGFVSRSESLRILAPELDQSFSTSDLIPFRWRGMKTPAAVAIVDNTGKEMARILPMQPSFKFAGPLTPGLYYWKLETEEDMMYLGKFTISDN